jgi:hypothetical protein
MKISKDQFSIDIVLRHPTYLPQRIPRALSLKPKASWTGRQQVIKVPTKGTFFYSCLQKDDRASEFESALRKVAAFLEKNSAFWTDFIGKDGEVELILNHAISLQEESGDKCFELSLAPAFLRDLSVRGVGLRVQGWQGGANGANRRDKKTSRSKLKAKS